MVVFYGSMYFRDCIYKIGQDILVYHGYVMMVVFLVLMLVLYVGYTVVTCTGYRSRFFTDHQQLEWWWTVIPMILLAALWCPSTLNLYRMDDIKIPRWNFKALGKQWYWSYECETPNKKVFMFDSYMKQDSGTTEEGGYRLLDVDHRMVAPAGVQTTVFVTSPDVLHSFSLYGTMLKVDAIPGRLNQLPLLVNRVCILYGQCSEICGVNHSFMPIVIEFIPEQYFIKWINAMEEFKSLG
uniref:Cytochrome c oxidase subunit 2 n=1 Tax=Septifer bilocularis TaxID=102393 RepID=A0A516EZL6_9BIVA|nr:cytochrome c oxidase subunit II [Septifer bilocularis]QDO71947.1 cytochrome c oxidase subunit II [Septifer bilocularis]